MINFRHYFFPSLYTFLFFLQNKIEYIYIINFHDSLGISFARKISSDMYSLKLKNITRRNLLPTTCQSMEYVVRDVSPGDVMRQMKRERRRRARERENK